MVMDKGNLQTQLNDTMILRGRFEHDHVEEESRAVTTETLHTQTGEQGMILYLSYLDLLKYQ